MALHKELPFEQIHVIHGREYANEAARTGATGLTSIDVGKVARQTDNDTWWLLTNHSPVTWIPVGQDPWSFSISDLTDADTTTVAPVSGQHLEWNGSEWVPGELETPAAHTHVEADITDLDHYDSADFDTDFSSADLTNLGTKAHSSLTGIGADDHHAHANKTELDLVTDGDHDVRTDNPHNVTVGQVGAASGIHTHVEADITDLDHYDSTDFDTDFSTANLDNLGTKNHNDLNGIGTDDHHAQSHTVASHSDTTATGAELDTLTDGSNADSLHTHDYSASGHTHTHASTTGQTANDHHNENHQARHNSGGADALKLDDLAAPDDNTDLNATTSKHGLLFKLGGGTTNYLRADGTWAEPPGGIVAHKMFQADQLESPNSSDWTVNSLAPLETDPTNTGLVVRTFDDSADEGVGFTVRVPTGASNIVLGFLGRAKTAPGSAKTVALDLYKRAIPDNAAVGSWSSATNLTNIDIPTNAYYQKDSQTISLATLGLTVGVTYQFELCRDVSADTLTGDWLLHSLTIGWT